MARPSVSDSTGSVSAKGSTSILALELRDYLRAVGSGQVDLAACVQEAGVRCTRCRSGRCARPSGWRCRKRVTDLSTGDVFEHIGIRQVIFCDGKTASLVPAELWRGLFTVTSVMETGIYILRDGLPAAYDWCWEAGRDGSPVSLPTLWRWRDIVGQRLMGSALRWLGPELRFSWADQRSEAAKLEALLKRLTPGALLGFRAQFGRACLDRARSAKLTGRRTP